jgi:hypothetical protein
MPDVLDRFGEQLRRAEQRHYGQRAVTTPAARTRRWPLTRRRGLLLGLAALIVTAPAAALVSPWNPTVGRPGIDEPTVPPSSAPYASTATESLGILRRPQTATDRAAATPVLRALGHPVGGVQLDGVRALSDGWVLAPVGVVDTGREPRANQLCITNGAAIGCGNATDIDKVGVSVLAANARQTKITGVVPDRVERVRLVTTHGTTTEVDARNNFYTLSVAETQPTRMIPAPKSPTYTGPDQIPSPPTPIAGTLEWLDDTGHIIGPRSAR